MLLRFLHYFGFALWMGGGWATMALVLKSRKETPAIRAGLFRVIPGAFGVMAGGAAITALSGLALAVGLTRVGLGARMGEPGIMVMQTAGLLGAIMVLAVGAPTARKLARLAAFDP